MRETDPSFATSYRLANAEPEPHPAENHVLMGILADIRELWNAHADAVRFHDAEALYKASLLLYERYEELEAMRPYIERMKAVAEIDPDTLDAALSELDFSRQSLVNVLK